MKKKMIGGKEGVREARRKQDEKERRKVGRRQEGREGKGFILIITVMCYGSSLRWT